MADTIQEKPAEKPAVTQGEATTPAGSGHNSPSIPRAANVEQQRIGPYILGKTLGVGSTGRVRLGTHVETGQKVAIKIVQKDASKQEKDLKMEREITIMKLIKHPNVLQIYDVYESSKELFLVLEQVEGGELFDYLVKRGRLHESEALHFFQQIICGVYYCHCHLICHRDLKPENLLLDKDYHVKVADFGMASLQVPSKMLETSCGSPHYASPEIIKGEKYDGPTTDVWSCGIILYALLTGCLPFDDENIRKLLMKVKAGVYQIPEHVSEGPRDLITSMLTVDPAKRPTLKQVMEHPWFKSKNLTNNFNSNLKNFPSPFELEVMSKGYPNNDIFDLDILESMDLLGWKDKVALLQALRSNQKNAEKVFYNLFLQRKVELLENYNVSDKYDNDGESIKRANSMASNDSNSSIDDAKNLPIRRRNPTRTSSDTYDNRRVISEGSVPTIMIPRSASIRITTASSEEDKSNSPLSASPEGRRTCSDSPGINRKASVIPKSPLVSQVLFDSAESFQGPELEPVIAKTRNELATKKTAVRKNPMNIGEQARPGSGSRSPNMSPRSPNMSHNRSGTAGSTGGTPIIAHLAALSLGKSSRASLPSTESLPTQIHAPKTSWFHGIFNFKPNVYQILSDKPLGETVFHLQYLLEQEKVRNKVVSPYLIKCKFDTKSGTGAFRIDIVSRDDVEEKEKNDTTFFKIQFIHRQGAYSTFQTIVSSIQQKWSA